MRSDKMRERGFEYARRALRVRRLAEGLTRASDRKLLEEYALELSRRAVALMTEEPASDLGRGRVKLSRENLASCKPRYP
jgi:hypothetical protein